MSKELCLCGIPKYDHADIEAENMIVDTVDHAYNHAARIQQKFLIMMTLYGTICTNYRRDNLKYLEEISNG